MGQTCPTRFGLWPKWAGLARFPTIPMIYVIIASYVRVSLRGVRLDWRGPFEIWKVANEGQQALIGDIPGSELRGLPLLLCLISGLLPIFALPFPELKRLLSLRLTTSNRLAYDHNSLSGCTDVIFQCSISICPSVQFFHCSQRV